MKGKTLRQLAQLAGVSATTVSKALRNDPKISESRRMEIQALAKRYGYRPNPVLSAWMRYVRDTRQPTQRETLAYITSQTLRVVRRSPKEWSYRYYAGAKAMAAKLGYACELFSIKDYKGDWERLFEVVHNRGIRAIAFDPLADVKPPTLNDESPFVLASIESLDAACAIDCVSTDHHAGMRLALEQAHARGYQRIGYIRSTLRSSEHEQWRSAYALYQMDHDQRLHVPPLSAPSGEEVSFSAFNDWYHKFSPDVVISSDNTLLALIKTSALYENSPLNLISLDQSGTAQNISGVDQRMEDVGAAVISMLAMKMELNETGPVAYPRRMYLSPKWIPGGSLA